MEVQATLNKMEPPKEIVLTSFTELNEYCLLEIAEYLDLFDVVNLSNTCRSFKEFACSRLFKKYTGLTIDRKMLKKGYGWINKVLSCVGPYVTSLSCNLEDLRISHEFWSAIDRHCSALFDVTINRWTERKPINFHVFECFDMVIMLTMTGCKLHEKSVFFTHFSNLYSLSLEDSAKASDLKMLLHRNPQLMTLNFKYDESIDPEYDMDMRWLRMVPELTELRTDLCREDEYAELVNAVSLTMLQLDCNDQNINDLLRPLAKKNTLQHLELMYVKFDGRTSDILKQFTKLEKLFINTPIFDLFGTPFIWTPSFTWPKSLKLLTLV